MKKDIFLIMLLITITIILIIFLTLYPMNNKDTLERSSYLAKDFQIHEELSFAMKTSELSDKNLKIADFNMIIDGEGFSKHLSIRAVLKLEHQYYRYVIEYYMLDSIGKYKIYKEKCAEENFEGIGIDTFSSYLLVLPKEKSSSIRSLGYYNFISITSDSQGFLVGKDGIKVLKNGEKNNLENIFVLYTLDNIANNVPDFYYLKLY